MMRALFLAERW